MATSYSQAFEYPRLRKIRKKSRDLLSTIPFEYLLGMGLLVLFANVTLVNGVSSTVAFVFFGFLTIFYAGFQANPDNFGKWVKRDGLFSLAGILLFGLFFADLLINDAHAQFLKGAETFLKDSLTTALTQSGASGGSDGLDNQDMVGMVGIFFTVIRAIFILYIITSIVKVVNAAREDEDWKQLARTPLIVVIAIVVGDSLVGLVTSTSTTG